VNAGPNGLKAVKDVIFQRVNDNKQLSKIKNAAGNSLNGEWNREAWS
jgi:hypothetical protein